MVSGEVNNIMEMADQVMDQLIEEHQIQNQEVMVEDNGFAIHGGTDSSSTIPFVQQGQVQTENLLLKTREWFKPLW